MRCMGQVNGKPYPIVQRKPDAVSCETVRETSRKIKRSAKPKKNGKKCVICGKNLVGLQRAYCSIACIDERKRRYREERKNGN